MTFVKAKPNVLFFDINETVLDEGSLRVLMKEWFSDDVFDLWSSTILQYSTVCSLTRYYRRFADLAVDSVEHIARLKNRALPEDFKEQFIHTMSHLPAHSGAALSLQSLKEQGFRVVALSNSSQKMLCTQLEQAGLIDRFDRVISTEIFADYKPSLHIYREAARKLGTVNQACMLIAAHDWDVYGALCAGFRAVFLKRTVEYDLPVKPELQIAGLSELDAYLRKLENTP